MANEPKRFLNKAPKGLVVGIKMDRDGVQIGDNIFIYITRGRSSVWPRLTINAPKDVRIERFRYK